MTALETTPGFQFQLGQGQNAINAAAAANGTLGSGNQLTALSQFNQGLAGNAYQNAVSNLNPYMSLANSSASNIGSLYSGLGNSLNSNLTSLGNLNYQGDVGIGNARASADLADQSMGLGLLGGVLNLGTSLLPGTGSLASGLSSGFGMNQWSDERLKENIEEVGQLYDGQTIYRYNYLGDETPRIGLMAQEVQKNAPEAVSDFDGLLAVDYGKATDYAAELFNLMDSAR